MLSEQQQTIEITAALGRLRFMLTTLKANNVGAARLETSIVDRLIKSGAKVAADEQARAAVRRWVATTRGGSFNAHDFEGATW